MEQNIIGLGFDLTSFSAEQQTIVKGLMEVYNLSKQIGDTNIKPGSTGGFAELKAQSGALSDLSKQYDNLNASIRQNSLSFDAQIKKLNDSKAALIANANLQKELTKDVKSGAISADEYRQRMTQLTSTQLKYKAVVTDLNVQLKNNTKEVVGLLSPYDALSKRYNIAAKNAQDLAAAQGIASPAAKAAAAEAKALQVQLLAIDETVGKSQRNVGNYSSTFNNFALTLRGLRGPTKLFGEALGFSASEADQFRLIIEHAAQALSVFFRGKEAKAAATQMDTDLTTENTAANAANNTTTNTGTAVIAANTVGLEANAVAEVELTAATVATTGAMRGLKIALASTGIGLLIVGIGYLVYKIIEFRKSMGEANAMTKIFAEVNEDAAKAAGKEVGSLKVLRAEIENVLIPMDKRLQAVKNLKDQYPELLKNTTDEALLQGQAADAYDRVAASILKKAQAQAAEAKIQELSSANLDIYLKQAQKATEVNKKIRDAQNDVSVSSGGSAGVGGNLGGVSRAAKQKALAEDFNAEKKRQQDLINLNNEKINFLLKFAGVEENIEFDKSKKDKKDKTKKAGELQALKDFKNTEYEINKLAQERLVKLYDEDVKDTDATYEAKIQALGKFLAASKALIDNQEQFDIAAKKREADREIKRLEEEKKGKNGAQVDRLNENILQTQKQLQADILLIQAQAADKSIALALDAAKRRNDLTIAENKSFADKQKSLETLVDDQAKLRWDKLSAELKKRDEDRVKSEKEAADKKEAIRQKDFELVQLGEDLIFTVLKAGLERRKELLKEEQEAIDKNTSSELAANQASTISNQEKAANAILIQANANAKKEQLDAEQRQLQRKQAEYEKATAIASIILHTAEAIVRDLGGKKYLIPLDIAVGAAQLAIAIATPIPTYGDGTENHPGGPMIVGEKRMGSGYQKELVTIPGEGSFITDRPMLLNAAAGSKVKPLTGNTLDEGLYSMMLASTVKMIDKKADTEFKDAIYDSGRMIVQALRKQKGANVVVNVHGDWSEYISKNVRG